jgi:endonuclease/exonuclease/phosphatase family metal-dependent hydrolase
MTMQVRIPDSLRRHGARRRGLPFAFVAVMVLTLGSTGVPAARGAEDHTLSILTRNQYLGGDLIEVAAAPDLSTFLAAARSVLGDIATNRFPERAHALAREIADRQPDIVALQEVYDFRLNFQNGAPPFVDHLAATLAALDALGSRYVAVASVRNLDVTLPADLDGDGVPESLVSATDRDVILARRDLVDAGAVAAVPLSSVCDRPSQDGGPGCNFVHAASAVTPLGAIVLERGFVAVDATIRGKQYRIVNTHLEVENLNPFDPFSPDVQSRQAEELRRVAETQTAEDRALIVVGDFNSTPVDPLYGQPPQFVRPFQQFAEGVNRDGQPAGSAFHDLWALRPGQPAGYTCCEPGDLATPASTLSERKDVLFSRDRPAGVKANLVGNDPGDKTPSGLWPSDHAGVWVRLRFAADAP